MLRGTYYQVENMQNFLKTAKKLLLQFNLHPMALEPVKMKSLLKTEETSSNLKTLRQILNGWKPELHPAEVNDTVESENMHYFDITELAMDVESE